MSDGADLAAVLGTLLAGSAPGGEVTLDQIGDAIGTRRVSTDQIDQLISDLERAGRRVVGPRGGGRTGDLRAVLAAARDLARELGRRPSADEIAARTGLDVDAVRTALALGRVMGR